MILHPLTGEIVGPDELTASMALDSLRGVDCQACGRLKRKFQAFCNRCYKRLPPIRRTDLLARTGEGFEEAFRAALKWLVQ